MLQWSLHNPELQKLRQTFPLSCGTGVGNIFFPEAHTDFDKIIIGPQIGMLNTANLDVFVFLLIVAVFYPCVV